MKKKITAVCLLAFVLLLGGCSKKEKEQTAEKTTERIETTETTEGTEATTKDTEAATEATTEASLNYEDVYNDEIMHVYNLIVGDETNFDNAADEDFGLLDVKQSADTATALSALGYTIKDLNGDDVPEMIVADVNGYIYKICSYDGKATQCIISGHARFGLKLMKDEETIVMSGSNGAAYVNFGKMHIAADGKSVEWDDYYFTNPDDTGTMHYYHNTTGEWDTEKAEELTVDEDTFWSYDIFLSEDTIANLGLTLLQDVSR